MKEFLFHRLTARRSIASGLAIVAGLGVLIGSSGLASAADYQLGTMDKLRIRVAEWQTAEGAIRDWSVVSGDYSIGPSGSLSLPFIGDLPASGKTTDAIAQEIGLALV